MGLPLYLYYVGVTLVQIPLGFVLEGNVLQQTSVVTEDSVVTTINQQPVESYDFNDDSSFKQDWN